MSILAYVRPWTVEYYRYVCTRVWGSDATVFASEHRSVDESGFVKAFYRAMKDGSADTGVAVLSAASVDEVITRCRLLRALPRAEAMRLVGAALLAWQEVLDEAKPVRVVSLAVDSYILDTLARVAQLRGVPYIGMIGVFVNGYWRLTSYGEALPVREPADEEVTAAVDRLLAPNFVPSYLRNHGSLPATLRRWSREWVKRVYFGASRRLSRDPLNFHTWHNSVACRETTRLNRAFPQWKEMPDWRDRMRKSGRPVVYIPLQYYPECSTDYWMQSLELRDYPVSLPAAARALASDYQVVIKEHPAMMGFRDPRLYAQLRDESSAIVVPHSVSSNDIAEDTDLTLVWTGTAGFEAAIRGKPVVTLGRPFYALGDAFTHVDHISELPAAVDAALRSGDGIHRDDVHALVRDLLRRLLPGTVYGHWPLVTAEDRALADGVAQSLATWVDQRNAG